MLVRRLRFVSWLLPLFFASPITAQFVEVETLYTASGLTGVGFGTGIAIDGDVLAVGTSLADFGAQNAGAVEVYRYTGNAWVLEQTLVPSNPTVGSNVGRTVAVSGDVIIAGSDENSVGFGAAYIFRFDGLQWLEEQILYAPDTTASNQFSRAVDVDGDRVTVSSTQNPGGNCPRLDMWKYDGTSWVYERRFWGPDAPAPNGCFIASGLSENRLVIAAVEVFTANQGFHVFEFDGLAWNHITEFSTSVPYSVSSPMRQFDLSDPFVAVGSRFDDTVGNNAGAAIVLRRNGNVWSEEQVLFPPTPGPSLFFGSALCLDGARLAVAEVSNLTSSPTLGKVHIYRRDPTGVWSFKQTLDPADNEIGDRFGNQLRWRDDRLVVGALFDSQPGASQGGGSIRSYFLDCDGNGVGDSLDIASGAADDCDGDGVPDLCQPVLPVCGVMFVRGDANDDQGFDLSDPIFTLGYLFVSGSTPNCLDAADANDDDTVNTADAIWSLTNLFAGGPPPPAPFPACGVDPGGTLGCAASGCP